MPKVINWKRTVRGMSGAVVYIRGQPLPLCRPGPGAGLYCSHQLLEVFALQKASRSCLNPDCRPKLCGAGLLSKSVVIANVGDGPAGEKALASNQHSPVELKVLQCDLVSSDSQPAQRSHPAIQVQCKGMDSIEATGLTYITPSDTSGPESSLLCQHGFSVPCPTGEAALGLETNTCQQLT